MLLVSFETKIDFQFVYFQLFLFFITIAIFMHQFTLLKLFQKVQFQVFVLSLETLLKIDRLQFLLCE